MLHLAVIKDIVVRIVVNITNMRPDRGAELAGWLHEAEQSSDDIHEKELMVALMKYIDSTLNVEDMKKTAVKHTTCPNCGKEYQPVLGKRKTGKCIQDEFPEASAIEREQLQTGICSDKCWTEYLGCEEE